MTFGGWESHRAPAACLPVLHVAGDRANGDLGLATQAGPGLALVTEACSNPMPTLESQLQALNGAFLRCLLQSLAT